MHKKVLLFFTLLLSLAGVAQATDYIKDVMVVGGTSGEVSSMRTTLEAQGWTRIGQDLNDNAGGDYIYLFYRPASSDDGVNHGYITGFYISNAEGTAPDTQTYDGRTYLLVPFDGGSNFVGSKGDLNRGAGGATIHLYYTTDLFTDNRVVNSITFNDTRSGAVPVNGSGQGYDLNAGCGENSDYIYMHAGTTTALPPTLTIAANDPSKGSVSATGFNTPDETLLTVFTPSGCTVEGRAILTTNNDIFVDGDGWRGSMGPYTCGTLEVNAAEGYTVTRITFTLTEPYDGVACEIIDDIYLLSFAYPFVWAGISGQYGTGKVTSISVYGYQNPVDHGTVNPGATVTISATPAANCHFDGWMEADSVYSRSADTVVTVTGNRTLTAHFAIDTYTLDVAASDPSLGSVSSTGFNAPDETLLTVITPGNNEIAQYSETGRATLNLSEWVYLSDDYNGIVWKSVCDPNFHVYYSGDLVVSAAEGYTVTRITFTLLSPLSNGPLEIAQPPFSIHLECSSVYNSTTYVGNYLTSISVYGYRNPVNHGTVDHGTVTTLSATPAANCHFDGWMEADTIYSRSADTVATCLGDRSFTALFALDTHTVALAANDPAMGSVAVTGVDSTASERLLTVITPADGQYNTPQFTALGRANVTFADADFFGSPGGWLIPSYGGGLELDAIGTISLTAAEGYTITRIPFTITSPSSGVVCELADSNFSLTTSYVSRIWRNGNTYYGTGCLTSLSVYGYRNPVVDLGAGTCTVDHGMMVNLSATPNPGYHFVCWREADSVYSRSADTVADCLSDRSFIAVFELDQHDYVDMGDGLLWATCNIGAANPWDYGDYFAWGETTTKSRYKWDTYSYCVDGSEYNFSRYTVEGNDTVLLAADDAAAANWHGDWRMPTNEEFTALRNTDNYSWVWTDDYNGTGVAGRIVTRLTGHCAGNSIFLPVTGYRSGGVVAQDGEQGYYWSSTLRTDYGVENRYAREIHMSSSTIRRYSSFRYYGHPVRAVSPVPTHSVVVNTADTTMGSVSGGGTCAQGSIDTLTATPKTGYHFLHWLEADTVYSRSADTVATILGDRSFTAVFEPSLPDLAFANTRIAVVGTRLSFEFYVINQGTADCQSQFGLTAYRNNYRGEVLADGFLLISPLNAGEMTNKKSYQFNHDIICSLGADDSLVIALNDIGNGIAQHGGQQAESDTVNNVLVLHVNTVFPQRHVYGVDTQAACDSLTWINGRTYTESSDTAKFKVVPWYVGGRCDSIATLHLTVNHSTTGDTTAVGCDSFSWYEHTGLTESVDTLTHLFTNAAGCDSTVTLNLTINSSNTGDTTAVVCDSLNWYGVSYSATSEPVHVLTNTDNCDSTVTLHRTVKYSTAGDTTAVVCDSLAWYGTNYIATAEPTHLFSNAVGCDSTVTLHLTVNHSNADDTTAVVCDSFSWYEHTGLTVSVDTLTHLFTNAAGCDSTVTLHLTVNYQNIGDTTAVECNSFSWYEHTGLTESVDTLKHIFVGGNQWGCDSTVTLNLTVNYSNTGDTSAVECDHFTWYGTDYTATAEPTHVFTNIDNCDSTVTLHLTVNYQNIGDTTAVVCDSFAWYGANYVATAEPTHLFAGANQWGCDSTVTLHLTVNYQNTGDTTAVECDQFSWYEHTGLTVSVDTLTHLFAGANQWGCDSTVTLHLTVNYKNTGDTTAVECDQFSWYEHTGLTASVDTLTHLFAAANQWNCDSTVTLHLTVNYQNTGDTTAVECDQFSWYEHTGLTASVDTLTHLFAGANQWGCDSTVTLHLTVNYQNTGDTIAVECDQFSWYEHTGLTASVETLTHLFAGANQWGCDSTVTLHLTVNYQNTGDTTAVECDQFEWYEHTGLTTSSSHLTHLFAGANQWGCDSTVTLNLTVNYSNTGDTSAVECDHFMWYGNDYTATGEPTHVLTNIDNCDSTVTLHLIVNYQNTGDTAVVVCDQFTWYGTEYTATGEPTHLFAGANQLGCDSTVTLHLTVNYQNTGDTTAVECDQFGWYEHTGLTVSVDTLTHLFAGANQWGCDSTVTLHLTVNYKNTGDTTAVECDQFSWYEHTGLTASVDTLTHLFVAANQWNCDSTVTLHLTVNYQNNGDTTAVECDQFNWYEHHNLTTSISTLTHRFVAANQWNCDSTVTLDLTINYQNTGDTSAVECDQFNWYEHQNITASTNSLMHCHIGANQWVDSTVTLHLTINYQNTGDTSALTYEPYNWYEHQNMAVTQNVQHTFVGANQWQCDSTVTLHLRYALFNTDWTGSTTVIYNSQQQNVIGATYVDDTGRIQQVTLTFTNGNEVITTPDYPVTAGVWNVVARPVLPVDSLTGATNTLTILPATVYVTGATAHIAKFVDGNTTAEVTDIGTLVNVQGNDDLTHTTTAAFNDATVGEGKTITLSYALQGTAALLNNYTLSPVSEVYTTGGTILDSILIEGNDAFDVAVYGYCVGAGSIGYHLASGTPDQYKLDYADSRFTDVDWTTASAPDGTLAISVPNGLPTGDYTVNVTFRDHRFPWIESNPFTVTFHVDLPGTFVKPVFDNVIALIDTCQCFTDIQWYHRANSGGEWQAIPGAHGYYYREEGGLTGEYFVSAKMNGMPTFTCPQNDLRTLVRDDVKDVTVTAYPNPTSEKLTLSILNSSIDTHQMRVMNSVGVELERRIFDGISTTIDMGDYQRGSYIVVVDGYVLRVVRN